MDQTEISKVAINEAMSPTICMVQQFFSVHEIDIANPISHIDPPSTDPHNERIRYWAVYMNLKDYRYFWLMSVKEEDSKAIAETGNSSEYARIYLNIASHILAPVDISARLNLPATRSHIIGDRKFDGKSPVTYKEHRYHYEPDVPDAWDFRKKMKNLINILSPRNHELISIGKESLCCEIAVAYYGWQQQMWGCGFDSDDLNALSSMGVSVDIDLYAEGPELPDED